MARIEEGVEQTAKGLDTLLQAVQTLPRAATGDSAETPESDDWHLDLLRTALRIARATEAPVDLERAGMVYRALPDELRARLAEHAAAIARRNAQRNTPAAATAQPHAGRVGGYLAGLFGRAAPAPSGSTAKERLLRDIDSSPADL